jgi:hypothetical protein
MSEYSGMMDGVFFNAEKPVVLLDWPDENSVKTFATEDEAYRFLASVVDPYLTFCRLYRFTDAKWNALPISKRRASESSVVRRV